jgi:ubiquinone biosynthesis monooxygenase Coq7
MDALILGFDRALRTISGVYRAGRPSPAISPDCIESDADRRRAAALMRVNHSGEVCAQALYQAQAAFSRSADTRQALRHSSDEELDHLSWTADRLAELGGRQSLLDPLWYAGAFGIGIVAARAGNAVNLGFLKETERQVVQHLNRHLGALPLPDERSREVLRQMCADEASHAELAGQLGGAELPPPIRFLMRLSARVLTTVAYRV